MASSLSAVFSPIDRAWIEKLPAHQIPAALAQLAGLESALLARQLEMRASPASQSSDGLVDAKEPARILRVPESHVRTPQGAGSIPHVKIGKYIRFRPSDVDTSLRDRNSK